MDRRRYIQTVTDQIRCKRALPLVTKELEDHIEDQKCDYMTEGMEPSEAEEAAVLEMGDPVEVGIEMDRIHRPKMAWKMIGLIAVLNLAGILLMYCLRTSALADVGNNPGEVEGITSGIGGNIDYLKNIAWTFAGLACMIGICYVDYSWIGKYAKRLAGIWIVVMGLGIFMGAVYINGAVYGIPFLFGMALPLRPLLYLIVPLYAAILYIESLSEELCGKSRPIHFRGVGTVVSKLFNIVNPDRAYFGQKDAQQLAIIKRMVRDLNFDIEIVGCPIVREEDGLAKSSRNTYLSKDERKAALILSKAVKLGEDMAKAGEKDTDKIVSEMIKLIETEPMAKIDYVQAVDAVSVKPVKEMTAPVLVAMAVYIGKTRLIDNFIYEG